MGPHWISSRLVGENECKFEALFHESDCIREFGIMESVPLGVRLLKVFELAPELEREDPDITYFPPLDVEREIGDEDFHLERFVSRKSHQTCGAAHMPKQKS